MYACCVARQSHAQQHAQHEIRGVVVAVCAVAGRERVDILPNQFGQSLAVVRGVHGILRFPYVHNHHIEVSDRRHYRNSFEMSFFAKRVLRALANFVVCQVAAFAHIIIAMTFVSFV